MIDLEKSLISLIICFQKESIEVVLIGGLACGVWKHIRATKDIDFLVDEIHYEKIIKLMKSLGYRSCKEFDKLGVIKFQEDSENNLVEVDFVMANKDYLKDILTNSTVAEYKNKIIKISSPEQLIILKMKALKDNPDRDLDLFDIKKLIQLNSNDINIDVLEKIAEKIKMMGLFDEIKKEFKKSL